MYETFFLIAFYSWMIRQTIWGFEVLSIKKFQLMETMQT